MNFDYHFNPTKEKPTLNGIFHVPGCKSMSHRALILPVACQVNAYIHNINMGHDVTATRKALMALGASMMDEEQGIIKVEPIHASPFSSPQQPIHIDMGNSGTSARLLIGLIAPMNGMHVYMTGDDSLIKRPMDRVHAPLTLMGANITLNQTSSTLKGTLPALISGQKLNGIEYTLPVASAQLKSAIMLAALRAHGTTTIIEPHSSRDHTENMLAFLGHPIIRTGNKIIIGPLQPATNHQKKTCTIHVPSDPSAAAFWCVAASIIPNSNITIQNINGNTHRTEFLNVLKKMGANIVITPRKTHMLGEPIWDLDVSSTHLHGTTTEHHHSADLMDEYPILSVAAVMANGVTHFKGIQELSVKESNRIAKITELLRCVGAHVEASNDDIIIHGQTYENTQEPIYFDTAFDHRMAMSAIILAKALNRPLHYTNGECIDTSFPSFRQQIC